MNSQSIRNQNSEENVRADYSRLTKKLIEKNLSISTMESATGGLIASLITDTEGSSAIIKGAFVTYSNEAKIKQGVPAEVIDKYSVYSLETAEAMAKACALAYGANIGIGVTGTMGNVDPANPEASVPGNVYYAIYFNGEIASFHEQIETKETRLEYKMAVAGLIFSSIWGRWLA